MTSAACREPFPPFAWELKHREDQPHKVRLYFAFKRLSDGPDSSYSGEGVVELVDTEGGWKADMTDGLGIW